MAEFRYDYEYLIHLLYCAIHDEKPEEKPERISFENVFNLGKIHEVGNIAFISVDKLEVKPEPELYSEWQLFYYHSIERDTRQKIEREQIVSALHSNGIRTLEVQGTVTKTFYPKTYYRMMSDIDFIVDAENLEKIEKIMLEMGYDVQRLDTKTEINAYNSKGMAIEFHTDFFTEHLFSEGEVSVYHKAISAPYSHSVPKEENSLEYIVDDTYFYLYNLLHTLKHIDYAGCGIRRVLDFYYLKSLENKIDMAYINSVIDKYGFKTVTNNLYQLEGYWFEGIAPKNDLSDFIVDIIVSGNHGISEIKDRNFLKRADEEGRRFPKFHRFLTFFFPNKYDIYEAYPFCKKHQLPTVICWLYRAVLSVGKVKNACRFVIKLINTRYRRKQ